MTVVKFLVDNGSAHFSLGDESESPDRPCGSLLTLLLFAISLNFAIAVTILRSSFRSYVFNILLLSLSLSLILDAGLNLAMASVIRASWTDLHRQIGSGYLSVFCHVNAASMQWPCLLEVYFLALLSAHRSIALGVPGKHLNDYGTKDVDFKAIRRLNGLCWLLAPVIVLPLALKAVDCGYFHERYSCSPAHVTARTLSAVLASLLFLLGYCLPWTAVLQNWISLILRVSRERRRLQTLELVALQRAAAQSSPLRGLGTPLGFSVPYWSQVWGNSDGMAGEGYRFFILAGLLTMFYVILVVPHSVYVLVTQFYTSYDVPQYKRLFDLTDELPPELRAISTCWLDNTFTWLRFLYTAVAPLVILIVHRDLRKQCVTIFNVCRSNNHVHASGNSLSSYLFTRKPQKKKRRSQLKTLDDVKTPVLFATSEGVFLRTAAAPYSGFNSFRASFPSKSAMIEPRFVSAFTDVASKQAGKSGLRVLRSPKLSARSMKNELENLEEDEVDRPRKGGKSVRFSQKVCEIPLNDSGVSSNGSAESAIVTVRPALAELRVADRKLIKPENRRSSDPFSAFTRPPIISEGVSRPHGRTLEQILSSSLSASSSSLLLSLSQRMRNRNS